MRNPITLAVDDAATAQIAASPQNEHPVLLALPGLRTDRQPENGGSCPEQLFLLETGNGPRVETALLREMLARSPDLDKYLADPVEGQHNCHPLASVNAYKHRLHALRCENANLRTRVRDLEIQLNRMCATRGWQMLEKYRRWRRTVAGWLKPNPQR